MSLKNATVLFADDDEEYALTFSRTLSYFFEKVLLAKNGAEAYEKFENNNCDIVILDLQMPVLSGIQVAQKIRTTNKEIPIFIVTNYQDFNSARSGYEYKLVDFLIKPVAFETLLTTLKRCEELLENNKKILVSENIYFDKMSKNIIIDDKEYKLSNAEAIIFEYMLNKKGHLIEFIEFDNLMIRNQLSLVSLKNIIYKLRQKLPKDTILSISKSGYLLK